MEISKEVIAGLRLIQQICDEEDRDFILIGALVPQILIDLKQGRTGGGRTTRDVDTTIEVHSWPEYDTIKHKLFDVGFRQGDEPHKLLFGRNTSFDVLPFGPGIVNGDQITWRETGSVMSALGFEEAFQSAQPKDIASDLAVPIISVPALVILKIMAYLDRPEERARDLVDLAYCLQEFERSSDARFELTSELVNGQPLYFEEAGAFLIGMEVARLANSNTKSQIEVFLGQITDEFARPITQIVSGEKRLEDTPRREDLFRLFMAFRAGFERHR